MSLCLHSLFQTNTSAATYLRRCWRKGWRQAALSAVASTSIASTLSRRPSWLAAGGFVIQVHRVKGQSVCRLLLQMNDLHLTLSWPSWLAAGFFWIKFTEWSGIKVCRLLLQGWMTCVWPWLKVCGFLIQVHRTKRHKSVCRILLWIGWLAFDPDTTFVVCTWVSFWFKFTEQRGIRVCVGFYFALDDLHLTLTWPSCLTTGWLWFKLTEQRGIRVCVGFYFGLDDLLLTLTWPP